MNNRSQSDQMSNMHDIRLFLRDEQLDCGLDLILHASLILRQALVPVSKRAGLSQSQTDILLEISYTPGQDIAHLRTTLGIPKPSFARLLSGLYEKDLIRRDKSQKDSRRKILHLSEKGEKLTAELYVIMREHMRMAYRHAGPEKVVGLNAVLKALANTLGGQHG